MYVYFGRLFKTGEDFYVFQLKDYHRVTSYVNKAAKGETLNQLSVDDLIAGKLYLYEDTQDGTFKRVFLKQPVNLFGSNLMCECLDEFVTISTPIGRLYHLPQSLSVIEPQAIKCKPCDKLDEDFVGQLDTYDRSAAVQDQHTSELIKIQVGRVDKCGFYHIKSVSVMRTTPTFSGANTNLRRDTLQSSNLSNPEKSGMDSKYNYNESKDFGFDFNYPETPRATTECRALIVGGGDRNKIRTDVRVENCLNKQQINKTKLQMTTKYTHEAKTRPYGVLVADSIDIGGVKKLSIPRCIRLDHASKHFTRAIDRLNLTLDSHFCQLLSFEHIVGGRNLSLVGTVRSGLSTALALGLSFKMHQLLTAGCLPTNKLHLIILVKNAASGRYLEKLFSAVFRNSSPRSPSLKIVFIDELNTVMESSADVITANVVIGSMRCVLEAVSQQFVVLKDVKCVFVDDAHVILKHSAAECQQFFNQIKQVEDKSNLWSTLPAGNKSRNPKSPSIVALANPVPCVQILTNSHKWNAELKSFQEAFVVRPLTFVIDPIEMIAYLAPSTYLPKMGFHANSNSLKSHFMNWVSVNIAHSNLLVFTRTALECEMVYEMCNASGVKTLRGTGFVDPGKLHDLNTIWCATRNSFLRYVFVVSDCALLKLTISDAAYTYHYTLPFTKADLRNRLGCSLTTYQSIANNTFTPKNHATPHNQYMAVCANQNCSNFIYCYKHLTVNCEKSFIDTSVNNFYKSKLYIKEYAMCDQLCPNIKIFGMCLVDKVFCKHSHLPWIINLVDHTIHRGSVTFTVSSVRCCTQLFGIVERFATGNPTLDQRLNETISNNRILLLNDLSFDMQLDNTKENIKFHPTLLGNNCVYACKDHTGAYSRCKLVGECVDNNKNITVYCIDTGINKTVNKNGIYTLPDSFKHIKPLVYEFVYTGYVPADVIYGWPNHLNIQITEALLGKTVQAHIFYGFDNTIWIDSLLQKSSLNNMHTNIVNFSLENFLKNVSCARACDRVEKYVGQLSHSAYQYKPKSSGHFKSLIGSTVDICHNVEKSLQRATICEFSSNHFHINHCNRDDIRQNIEKLINDIVTECEQKPSAHLRHYRINDLCLARFPDKMWYRARITQFNEPKQSINECSYNVYMIDIGEVCCDLQLDHLIPIANTHSLTTIPGLAVRCQLADADFGGLNEDQLDAVFDYLDELHDNLYVLYECSHSHTKSDERTTEITHCIRCFCSIKQGDDGPHKNGQTQFRNVLMDLFLDFHVKPSDSFNQVLYKHFGVIGSGDENKNNNDAKFSEDEWATFVARAKKEASIRDQLKALLNQDLPVLNDDSQAQVDEISAINGEDNDTETLITAKKTNFINRAPKCVKWFETLDGFIRIRIISNDPSDVIIDIDENYFSLSFQDNHNGCDIGLNFFGSVKAETKTFKVTPSCLYVSVEKQKMIEWSNLFETKSKLRWVVYDYDSLEVEEKPSIEKAKDTEKIDWSLLSAESTEKKTSSHIEFRLPEDDDRFEPTSSESSELEGFHSDVEDHELD